MQQRGNEKFGGKTSKNQKVSSDRSLSPKNDTMRLGPNHHPRPENDKERLRNGPFHYLTNLNPHSRFHDRGIMKRLQFQSRSHTSMPKAEARTRSILVSRNDAPELMQGA
ncbi:hypothetical protein CHS0354_001710, partial [Potamilus streckersoni]